MCLVLTYGQSAHATIGANCDIASGDPDDPLIRACDRCAGEFCDGQTNTCAQGSIPPCPNPQIIQPGCWTSCENTLESGDGFFIVPECVPNDNFCNDISGGNASNECRVGVCSTDPEVAVTNPSGCDYTLETDNSSECRNCIPEGLATLENCGNGICEPDEGEACDTCAVDCLLPGFEDVCPLTTGIVIRQACQLPIPQVTFDGPPYNVEGLQNCEDGDLCTDNTCNESDPTICDVTPKSCKPDADFCCPSGCVAPTSGTCHEVTGAPIPGCDPDCYVPEQCVPTPSPTPPPVFAGCLEGGGGWGEKSGPGCGGAACSLNTAASAIPGFGFFLSMGAALALGAYRNLRRRD